MNKGVNTNAEKKFRDTQKNISNTAVVNLKIWM